MVCVHALGLVEVDSLEAPGRLAADQPGNITPVDRLVQGIGKSLDLQCDAVDESVNRVDGWLARNRQASAA